MLCLDTARNSVLDQNIPTSWVLYGKIYKYAWHYVPVYLNEFSHCKNLHAFSILLLLTFKGDRPFQFFWIVTKYFDVYLIYWFSGFLHIRTEFFNSLRFCLSIFYHYYNHNNVYRNQDISFVFHFLGFRCGTVISIPVLLPWTEIFCWLSGWLNCQPPPRGEP